MYKKSICFIILLALISVPLINYASSMDNPNDISSLKTYGLDIYPDNVLIDIKILDDAEILTQEDNETESPDYTKSYPVRFNTAVIISIINGYDVDDWYSSDTDNIFKDTDKSNDFMVHFFSFIKSHPEIGFVGCDNKFDLWDNVSSKELYKVLLTNLGYKQDVDFEYQDTIKFAQKIGLTRMNLIKDENKITDAELWFCIAEALRTQMKDNSKTYIESLVDKGIYAKDIADRLIQNGKVK